MKIKITRIPGWGMERIMPGFYCHALAEKVRMFSYRAKGLGLRGLELRGLGLGVEWRLTE